MKNKAISEHISSAIKSGKSILDLEEAREIMELSGIPFNKSGFGKTEDEVVSVANEMGYPVALKIVSPQIVHKTESGGVKLDINSEEEVKFAYREIMKSVKNKVPDAEILGISIDEMVKGTELIIGTTVDPQFGHMIMFGIGGIFVEIYEDVSFRLIPITSGDAKDMLNEIKGRPLLDGARGRPKIDEGQLVDILMKVSELVDKNPDIQEMDLNPLMANESNVVAVDARIILKKSE
ncbi:MAG: acetate--CoA ligase family protein [Thermoplasmata archaeon]|nr:MAG: acetate--CoA ligase family protein [Thermoplasmata archaeon]